MVWCDEVTAQVPSVPAPPKGVLRPPGGGGGGPATGFTKSKIVREDIFKNQNCPRECVIKFPTKFEV